MNVTDTRRTNLLTLLESRFDNNKAALGRAVGRQGGYVGSMLPAAPNPRAFGEAIARDFEQQLNLPTGWFDQPQSAEAAHFEPGPAFTRGWQVVHIKGCAQLGPDGYWDALSADDGSVDVPSSDPDAYALRVKGDSMMPAIRSGWVVWCEPNRDLVPSEYVMVRTTDGQCTVKELLYINDREVSLMAVNDGYGRLTVPIEQIEQIHHVGGIVAPSKIRY